MSKCWRCPNEATNIHLAPITFFMTVGLCDTCSSKETLAPKIKEKQMPVPGGEITTSEILKPVVEEVVEVSTTEEDEDDLPELS
jgi:hypothetical protein